MNDECLKMACDASCVQDTATRRCRRFGTALPRAALTAGALLLVGALILLITMRAGPGRTHRGSWAVGRASRILLWALGVRLQQRGGPRPGASLVVANHVSWLDVLVLAAGGSMLPVAKAEIASWPLIGILARRCGVLFIHRRRLSELPTQVDRIADELRRGHRVQVFPEATTRCGTSINSFRRAAFQAAIDAAVVISPVAVSYRDSGGDHESATAFVGEMSLWTSVLIVLRAGPITAEATWLPTIPAIVATGIAPVDRARAASAAERSIARTLHQRVLASTGPASTEEQSAGHLHVPAGETESCLRCAALRPRTLPIRAA